MREMIGRKRNKMTKDDMKKSDEVMENEAIK
jgi:hypothetical protein